MKIFEKIGIALAYIVGLPIMFAIIAGLVYSVWDQLFIEHNYLAGGICLVVFSVGGWGIWYSVFREEKPYRDYIPPPPQNRRRRR